MVTSHAMGREVALVLGLVLRGMASGDDRYVAAPDPVAIPSIYRDLTQRVACPPEVFWGRR